MGGRPHNNIFQGGVTEQLLDGPTVSLAADRHDTTDSKLPGPSAHVPVHVCACVDFTDKGDAFGDPPGWVVCTVCNALFHLQIFTDFIYLPRILHLFCPEGFAPPGFALSRTTFLVLEQHFVSTVGCSAN